MISINEVTLYGRLGDNAEIKKTKSDTEFMRFRIATNRPFKKKDGTYDEETQWHQVVVWDSALVKTFKGKGCSKCNQTGYSGRQGIYEVLKITPAIQDAISLYKTRPPIFKKEIYDDGTSKWITEEKKT